MKKILLLHPNFPGQFKHVADYLAREGNEIKFLCETHYGREIKGVERIAIKKNGSQTDLHKQKNESGPFRVADRFYSAMKILSKNYSPDVIISHSGWDAVYMPDNLPQSK